MVGPDVFKWHSFAGGGINRLLAAELESLPGDKGVVGNLTLKSKVPRLPAALIDDDDALIRACAELAREPFVALDVETTLDTRALCLVPLGARDRVVVVAPSRWCPWRPLRRCWRTPIRSAAPAPR